MSDLKPCPFCGSTDVHTSPNGQDYAYVYCNTCGAEGPTNDIGSVALTWNRRAQPAQAVPASCGECGKKTSDGWALYCVACMEKAGLPAQAGRVLSEEEMLRAILPLCHDDSVARLLVENSGDEYRAIEQAVMAKRVPMTPEETDKAMRSMFYPARNRAFMDGIRAAERHHGIVGEKGGA